VSSPVRSFPEDQVGIAGRRRVVGRGRSGGVELHGDLLPLRVVRLHERNVDDLDRQLGGRVLLALVVAAQVDDEPDPVVDERAPALVAELPDAVGANDRTAVRLASVGRRQAAEVADVETAVPHQVPGFRQQRPRAGCP
jgi:hypothetical protein